MIVQMYVILYTLLFITDPNYIYTFILQKLLLLFCVSSVFREQSIPSHVLFLAMTEIIQKYN